MPTQQDVKFSDYVRGLPAASESDLSSGNNFPLVMPDSLKKMGGEKVAKESEVSSASTIYKYTEIAAVVEEKNKFVRLDGSIADFNGYSYRKYAVNPNTMYAFTSSHTGSQVYAVIEMNGDAVVNKLYIGVNGGANRKYFERCALKTGSTTNYVYINSQSDIYPLLESMTAFNNTTIENTVRQIIDQKVAPVAEDVANINTNLSAVTGTLEPLKSTYSYTELQPTESGVGYVDAQGVIRSTFTSYRYAKFAVSSNTDYSFTTKTNGGVVYAIIELNSSGSVVNKIYQGKNSLEKSYEHVMFKTSSNTSYIYLNNSVGEIPALETFAQRNVSTIENTIRQIIDQKIALIPPYKKSNFEGKTIAWFGTSIPAQGYPSNCGQYLGAIVKNEAIGSSMARCGRFDHSTDPLSDDYLGIKGVAWQNVLKSLSMTQAEKHYIMECWTTERRKAKLISQGYSESQVANVKGFVLLLGGDFYGEDTDPTTPKGSEPTDIMLDEYIQVRKTNLGTCWDSSNDIEPGFGLIEGRLQKYFTSEKKPDLWVLDHGHNDGLSFDTAEQLYSVPSDVNNRFSFIGALNYLTSKILEFDPRAKIAVIGHYTNEIGGTNRPVEVCKGQENFAAKWQFPLLKLWERLPFSQSVVTTNGYWGSDNLWHDTGFNGTNHTGSNNTKGFNQNPRQVNGVWVHDLTMKQIYLKDDLHPASAITKDIYGHLIANWIKALFG